MIRNASTTPASRIGLTSRSGLGSVGKRDLDAADIEARGGAVGVGFCRRGAQPVDRLRRRRERRAVGLQRCLHRADAFRDGGSLPNCRST